MKKFAVIVLLILSAVLFAAPIRSNLGGEGTEMSAEPSYNELGYVADGLSVMWDGVFNAVDADGNLYHDSSATIWKDLEGDFDLELRETAHFSLNCLVTSTRNRLSALADRPIDLENCTVEICASAGNQYKGGVVFFSGLGDNRMFCSTGSYHEWLNPATETNELGELPLDFTAACYFGSNWVLSWCNGDLLFRGTTVNKWAYASVKANFAIGGSSRYSAYSFVGRIYSIRIYNRRLDQSEITHNHFIDKERFGL